MIFYCVSIGLAILYVLQVPSVLFAPSHLVTLFTLGISSGLVIDAGYAETVVLPVSCLALVQFSVYGRNNN